MEEKRTIFDYLAEVMIVFGFTMLVMNIICLIFGDSAKGFSALFELGNQGISVKISFQFFCISILNVGVRFVFFTDVLIKKMSICFRVICMLVSLVIITAVFIIVFDWFPANMWLPWVMFLLCFGVSFLGGCFMMILKEKVENRQMEEALQRLKEKEEAQND